ncbi:hypothetical protein BHE74_00020170, partial [Ensete ventricosum]
MRSMVRTFGVGSIGIKANPVKEIGPSTRSLAQPRRMRSMVGINGSRTFGVGSIDIKAN